MTKILSKEEHRNLKSYRAVQQILEILFTCDEQMLAKMSITPEEIENLRHTRFMFYVNDLPKNKAFEKRMEDWENDPENEKKPKPVTLKSTCGVGVAQEQEAIDALIYDETQSSYTYRVGKLVSYCFDADRPDAEKEPALRAIISILKDHINPELSYQNLDTLTEEIVEAINSAYPVRPDLPDSFMAFMQAVKENKLELADNNPLVLYERQNQNTDEFGEKRGSNEEPKHTTMALIVIYGDFENLDYEIILKIIAHEICHLRWTRCVGQETG